MKSPTTEQIIDLYFESGESAYTWYAWRNTLRVLPALGYWSLDRVWPENTIKHTIAVCRIPILLALWGPNLGRAFSTDRAHTICYELSVQLSFANMFAADTASDVPEVVSDALMAIHDMPMASCSKHAIEAYDAIAFDISGYDLDVFAANSISELVDDLSHKDFLIASKETDLFDGCSSLFCDSLPLWSEKPDPIAKWEDKLLTELNDLGLDLIASDLEALWNGRATNSYALNYARPISEADMNNPEAFRSIILGGESGKIHAVRALVLGSGGAGKSSLVDRLQGKPIDHFKEPTQGIEYLNHYPLELRRIFPEANLENKDLNIYLWDFGGQAIFHGLHRTFLHENCVYILVVDSRQEQAPDEWLFQVRHIAGSYATVILVTNQHEGCDIRQNEKRLLREFGDILNQNSFHYFSCIESSTLELNRFVDELVKVSLNSQRQVWSETLNIQQAIRRYTEQNNEIFISVSRIKEIIRQNGRVEDSKAMINSLEQLGFLARINKGSLSYCLKPEWAVDRSYELLHSDTLRKAKGKLSLIDFDNCFVSAPTEDQQEKLLNFLEHRSLCFKLSNSEDTYFFPDAATTNEPSEINDLLRKEQCLVVRFDLPYLPLGFHTRLVKPLFNTEGGIRYSRNIWRHGFIMQLADSYAVVQYLLRKSSIETTLVGNSQHYARLLETFNFSLVDAVSEKDNNSKGNLSITPFVLLNDHMFTTNKSEFYSVHSVSLLIDELKKADGDLKIFTQEVPAMAGKPTIINNTFNSPSLNSYGDSAVNTQYNQRHTKIDNDQRQQIALIVDELLKNAATLPADQVIATAEVKKALEVPIEDEKAQNILGVAWKGINDLADFTKDKAIPITDFVIKNKEALGVVFATVQSTLVK